MRIAALLGQRDVDVTLADRADAAVIDVVDLDVVGRGEAARVRLVGDDADRAGFRARAVERALRTGERLHARDVVGVDVERAADRGDRLLVEIDADAGLRAGMVAVIARRHAAHVDVGEARPVQAAAGGVGAEGDAGQELGVVAEALDVKVLELLVAEHLDGEGDVLDVLGALFGGHDDGLDPAIVGRDRDAGERRGCQQSRQKHRTRRPDPAHDKSPRIILPAGMSVLRRITVKTIGFVTESRACASAGACEFGHSFRR